MTFFHGAKPCAWDCKVQRVRWTTTPRCSAHRAGLPSPDRVNQPPLIRQVGASTSVSLLAFGARFNISGRSVRMRLYSGRQPAKRGTLSLARDKVRTDLD